MALISLPWHDAETFTGSFTLRAGLIAHGAASSLNKRFHQVIVFDTRSRLDPRGDIDAVRLMRGDDLGNIIWPQTAGEHEPRIDVLHPLGDFNKRAGPMRGVEEPVVQSDRGLRGSGRGPGQGRHLGVL